MIKISQKDCFEEMCCIEDNSVDLVFTSPPYNRKRNDKFTHYDDTISDYYGFLERLIEESLRVSSRHVFINIQKIYYNKADVYKIIGRFCESISEFFIWEKSNPMPASGSSITNSYEFVIAFGDTVKSNRTYTKNHITTSVAKMPDDHKAVMHPKIASFFLENFSRENDTVYDPFMGTGTTATACIDLGLNCIGSEISEEYFNNYLKELNS